MIIALGDVGFESALNPFGLVVFALPGFAFGIEFFLQLLGALSEIGEFTFAEA